MAHIFVRPVGEMAGDAGNERNVEETPKSHSVISDTTRRDVHYSEKKGDIRRTLE